VTSGGIHGTVATVEESSLLVKVAENTKIRISTSAVAGLVGNDGTTSEG
jgi:preprotein translocase subunit YajC